MLGSITPLGERGHRRRWSATVTCYLLGSLLGGLTIGGLLGLGGAGLAAAGLRPSAVAVLVVVGGLSLLGIALDLRLGGIQLPTVRRQVDEDWLTRYRGWVVGVGFGFQLGAGVVTIVTTASVYVALATALLAGSFSGGLALGAGFGLLRALPQLATRRVRSPSDLRAQHRRLARWAPRADLSAVGGQLIVAAVALGTVVLTIRGGVAA
ncbi:MAG TPA: hypothetical protein VGD91_05575 [Trebonia sp.]